jgi:hypothetical protein
VLKASRPRSDLFPAVWRWTAAADHRRKGAPEQEVLFLGGNAWRTLASGDGDAQGLLCKLFFDSRVFCIKRMDLSLDRRSPRARIERAVLKIVPVNDIYKKIRGLSKPRPPFQKKHHIFISESKYVNISKIVGYHR